jgi:ethanolamine ammonia-lyase small subunit
MSQTPRDPWAKLSVTTSARIALGRTGASLPTRAVLDFALAHAMARDAVHAELDTDALCTSLRALGLETALVTSLAPTRAIYLQRPDLGRRLSDEARGTLATLAGTQDCDIAFVVGDGLSARAVNTQAAALLRAFLPNAQGLSLGPAVVVRGARVAIGDEIGALLRARLAVVLIGERPGLSSPDSLGIYVTHDPRPGRNDGERNCISNIRPEGLPPEQAAERLAWLMRAALTRGITGVALKDESPTLATGDAMPAIPAPPLQN